jgi:hypothetical protein
MTRAEHLDVSDFSAADVAALLDAVRAVAEPVRISGDRHCRTWAMTWFWKQR